MVQNLIISGQKVFSLLKDKFILIDSLFVGEFFFQEIIFDKKLDIRTNFIFLLRR